MKQNITKMSFRELLALKECLDVLNGKYSNEMRAFPTSYGQDSAEKNMQQLCIKQTKITNELSNVISEIERRILE